MIYEKRTMILRAVCNIGSLWTKRLHREHREKSLFQWLMNLNKLSKTGWVKRFYNQNSKVQFKKENYGTMILSFHVQSLIMVRPRAHTRQTVSSEPSQMNMLKQNLNILKLEGPKEAINLTITKHWIFHTQIKSFTLRK
jgi:hypothetical protein